MSHGAIPLAKEIDRVPSLTVPLDHAQEQRFQRVMDSLIMIDVHVHPMVLPEDMERTIAKQAEAERERRAVIIQSQGEVAAAENMAKAAQMLAGSPGALHLRTLQSINDISSDQSNTVVFAVPLEALRAMEGLAKLTEKKE